MSYSSVSVANAAVWCAIPVYNNQATLRQVALGCRRHVGHVLVVDDGSTDADVSALLADTDIQVVRHSQNLGKGAALQTALRHIAQSGGRYMITIDGDGQHFPDDLPHLLERLDPETIVIGDRRQVIGNMPGKSRFGRRFSDFWVMLETGQPVSDSQSGFRAYPVDKIRQLPLRCRHYDFEIEVLARAAWAGLAIVSVPIKVRYEPPERRVSSFRPVLDNLRISLTHTRLIGRRLLPWPTRRLTPRPVSTLDLLEHPAAVFRRLLKEAATPAGLAAAAAVGIFLGALPLVGLHIASVFYVSLRLKLNKVMALAVQNICMPPVVPAVCIAVGFFLRHGYPITEISLLNLAKSPGQRFIEWWIGSLIVGPLLAGVVGAVVYVSAAIVQKRMAVKC